MPPQQLLLSWKDHNGALVSVFENLLKGNSLVDCTLAAEGQYLKAHKIVLSACSSYFELLFSQENEKNPIVILKDVKFQELEAAVNFMYRGEVEVCEDRLTAFLEVANSLQIKGLGSDGETQDFRPSSPSLKGLKTAVPPKSHSREEVSFSQSWNTGDGCITIDSDKNSNERSSHFHLPHRETSCSSPISSTFATTSSYSLASASTSGPVRTESVSGGVKVKNNQCSSPSVSLLPPGDTVPSDVNTVVKSEPVIDMYLDEKSNEAERDCDMKMEDQEDWEDPNLEYMGDDHASNQQDPGFSLTEMKTEESISAPAEHISSEDGVWVQDRCGNDGGNTPAPQFASTFFQEHQPSPSPSFGLVSEPTSSITSVHQDTVLVQDADGGGGDRRAPQFASVFLNEHQPGPNPGPSLVPAPAPAPVPGPASGVAPSRQGAVPAGSAQRKKTKTKTTTQGSRYQCHDCGYSTSTPSLLARHQLVHTGKKPYKCTVCAYATTEQGNIKTHMRIHTGEKPYKCTVCTYAATQQASLKIHMRVHTGEKPYKCTVCTYASTLQSNLKTHMRIHTGEKPFKCMVCTYATSHQGHLKRHMLIHTREIPR